MEKARDDYILIVDDNPINVDLLTAMLERVGYDTKAAFDGEEALEFVDEKKPELILLDINMPGIDGYEVCQRLKADNLTADIPVIFISALQETSDILRGFEVGGVDYIGKPFKFREVLARVDTQIAVYQQRKQLEQNRIREREHFAMIDRMRQQFIGAAAHDLKNPLFIVGGYASILETIPAIMEDELSQQAVEGILRGVEKMNTLVVDMLDLLQLETGIPLQRESVSLNQFLAKQVDDISIRADEKNQTLILSLPDDGVNTTVNIDLHRMERVLDNLVSNAIKYTPPGGIIELGAETAAHSVTLYVKDNGLGIPADALPTLFDPFQRVQTKDHLAIEGTGLGLSIVKAIVEQHGGSTDVKSQLGQGSTFSITLPR